MKSLRQIQVDSVMPVSFSHQIRAILIIGCRNELHQHHAEVFFSLPIIFSTWFYFDYTSHYHSTSTSSFSFYCSMCKSWSVLFNIWAPSSKIRTIQNVCKEHFSAIIISTFLSFEKVCHRRNIIWKRTFKGSDALCQTLKDSTKWHFAFWLPNSKFKIRKNLRTISIWIAYFNIKCWKGGRNSICTR